MRITNKMMSNNVLNNINKNKNHLSRLDQQYSTGKKIQRPSEDPIIAVRALKLRTNLNELKQYLDKNIKDAYSWMDVTEGALTNMNDIIKNINTSCVQGTNDPLTASDRKSIAENLKQYKGQIYQEGNANYAGRYVFTGYKTDKSLIFNDDTTNLDYKITEKLTGSKIEEISKVTGEYALKAYDPANPTANTFSNAPTLVDAHRLRLAYNNVSTSGMSLSYTETDPSTKVVTKVTINGTDTTTKKFTAAGVAILPDTVDASKKIEQKLSSDPTAYKPGADDMYYLSDTGEMVLGDNIYNKLRLNQDISVTYGKTSFKEGDLRPENYFDCTAEDSKKPELGVVTYTKADQKIDYEINFNQNLTVNTQGCDTVQHAIGRDIDEILNAVSDVEATEGKITEVKKMLKSNTIQPAQTEALNKMLDQLNTELVLKNKVMHNKFEDGISGTKTQQEVLNVAVADLGSRYNRLQLTESRLTDQKVDFEELLSSNEDADIADTYVRLTSAETIYNASLSSAAKVFKSSLLDFI